MRYMMLIYSERTPDLSERNYTGHRALIDDAIRKGVFVASEPLAPISSATTVRTTNDKVLVTDGPFAETKEQLAGYYILNCENLDDAIEWAGRISCACDNVACVEIRPMPGLPPVSEAERDQSELSTRL